MKSARDEAWIVGGEIHLDHKGRFREELKRLEGARVQVHVFTGVTVAQRGYYRAGILKPLSERNGNTPNEWHEILKRKFNPIVSKDVVNEQTGEVGQFVYGGSFEDMGSSEFALVLDDIIEWGRTVVGADIKPPTPAERREMGIGQEDRDGLHDRSSRRREARGG